MQERQTFLASADLPPDRSAIRIGIPGGQQHLHLVSLKGLAGSIGGRPPLEATFGQAFLRQDVPLSVIAKYLKRGAASVQEEEECSREWVFVEFLATEPRKSVNPLPSVHRVHRNQYPHMGRDL